MAGAWLPEGVYAPGATDAAAGKTGCCFEQQWEHECEMTDVVVGKWYADILSCASTNIVLDKWSCISSRTVSTCFDDSNASAEQQPAGKQAELNDGPAPLKHRHAILKLRQRAATNRQIASCLDDVCQKVEKLWLDREDVGDLSLLSLRQSESKESLLQHRLGLMRREG